MVLQKPGDEAGSTTGSRLTEIADVKLNSHRKLSVGLWISGNGECVCVCACVSWLPLLLLRWSDNDNESIAALKRTEDGFYLFLKYYVVPISCFVKMMNVQFPSCPQRPRQSHTPHLSLCHPALYQCCLSIWTSRRPQCWNCENWDIASFWRFWAFNASYGQAWLCAAIFVQYPLEDPMTWSIYKPLAYMSLVRVIPLATNTGSISQEETIFICDLGDKKRSIWPSLTFS